MSAKPERDIYRLNKGRKIIIKIPHSSLSIKDPGKTNIKLTIIKNEMIAEQKTLNFNQKGSSFCQYHNHQFFIYSLIR